MSESFQRRFGFLGFARPRRSAGQSFQDAAGFGGADPFQGYDGADGPSRLGTWVGFLNQGGYLARISSKPEKALPSLRTMHSRMIFSLKSRLPM
jgi:hypothetical protein